MTNADKEVNKNNMTQQRNSNGSPVQKAWITGSIYAFIVVMLLLIKTTFNVWLLILAGILIAVFFGGFAGLIQRKTGWKPGLSKVLSVVATLLFLVGLFWLIGAKVQQQATQLADSLPSTIDNAEKYLQESSLGQKVLEKINSSKTETQVQSIAAGFFKSTFGVFGDLYAVLFIGLFFFVSPQLYKKGIVHLIPANGRQQGADLLDKLNNSLRKWLKGTMLSMLTVFTLTAIGLAIIGIDMWLVLALLAGLLSFIPNLGPLIALIPAVLVGLLDSPTTALIVAGLYILVQVVESNFITPVIQQKMVNTPPALILIVQLFMAALTGGWGLVLATPLLVIVMVVVQELYVKRNE